MSNKYLILAIFCMATGFLVPLGVVFLVLFLWEGGVKDAIKKEKKEQEYINGYDSSTIRELI
jgi:hypothetical protein